MIKPRKIIYWAENTLEAELIQNVLEEYGIPSRILQESFGAANGLNFGIFGQIAIEVDEERAAEAEALVMSVEDDLEPED